MPIHICRRIDTTSKVVKIARSAYPTGTQPLVVLLRSGGIKCYSRNELNSQIMVGYMDVDGARVEILGSDVPQATKIMEEDDYDLPRGDEQAEPVEKVTGFVRYISFLRKYPLEKQIMTLPVIVAVFPTLVIHFGLLISLN